MLAFMILSIFSSFIGLYIGVFIESFLIAFVLGGLGLFGPSFYLISDLENSFITLKEKNERLFEKVDKVLGLTSL
jgi:uncharacterized membrane protein